MTAGARPGERTIFCRGVDLFVREGGNGFPVLMINGLGNNSEDDRYRTPRKPGGLR
jgi:hypothetical protein